MLQEEQRIGGLSGRDDALAGLIAPGRRQFCQRRDFLRREIGQQRLLAEMYRVSRDTEAAIAIDHLILGPFDRIVQDREMSQPLGIGDVGTDRRVDR